jgi:hypothetical protein
MLYEFKTFTMTLLGTSSTATISKSLFILAYQRIAETYHYMDILFCVVSLNWDS